jgi:hypothetical protein
MQPGLRHLYFVHGPAGTQGGFIRKSALTTDHNFCLQTAHASLLTASAYANPLSKTL